MNYVKIYCDGACSGNPGPGGWGACIIYDSNLEEIYGYELETTNNKMELMGAIKAIKHLSKPSLIDLYTDSKYVQMGMNNWIKNWLKNNWRTSANKAVKNVELWQELLQLNNLHQINWHWVKGHANDKYNILADTLAVKGRQIAITSR